jgi:cell division protein FtsW
MRASGATSRKDKWARISAERRLWVLVTALVGFGLVMIYSASAVMSLQQFDDGAHYLKRQLLFAAAGLVTIAAVGRLPYQRLRVPVYLAATVSLAALALVLHPQIGAKINHARRWFLIGPVSIQPAEFAKIFWVMFLGISLCVRRDKLADLREGMLPYIVLLAVFCGLLLLQPDFGTVVILSLVTCVLLLVGGVPWRHLLLLAPPAVAGFYFFVYRVGYRWDRVTAFLNPWTDPQGSGYHLIQARVAVGSGGIAGVGLGGGEQKLFYLPEPYTDFIFAVIGEELGLLGIVAVAVLFGLLLHTGLQIAKRAPDAPGSLIALGLTLLLCLEGVVNMAVVLGLLPTKGLPLPFLSYGGSSLTASCLAVGMLLSIARASAQQKG